MGFDLVRKNMDKELMIMRWQESGLSAMEFCRREGIVYSTFNYWKRRCHESSDQFIAVEVEQDEDGVCVLEMETRTATLRFSKLPPSRWVNELLGLDG